ncbi:hypothetical protein PsorP6_015010 [Peronosclerospora sorghi]|uniref:Uncharacterized protein n=1 Tax=Peronosclerospora sorghi TaxID=230839 RepID=A0ACC0VTQ8_9STRA|nr:hypothetical protein PsorP6_015010 [Peronosclerospora sorghi]
MNYNPLFNMESTPSAQDFMNGMMAIVQRQQEIIEEMRQQRQVPRKAPRTPKYFGRLDESLDLYFFQAQKYCQSQNIDMFDDRYLIYAISLITINLRGAAAAWNQEFV